MTDISERSERSSLGAADVAKPPRSVSAALVDCAVYVEGRRLPGTHGYSESLALVRSIGAGRQSFVWVGLHDPDERDMQDVAEVFGLHALAVEDVVHAHQRPKVERYEDTLFLVLKTVNYVPHESVALAREIVETGEIMIFTGPDFVVTVRHGDFSGLSGLRTDLEASPEQLRLGPQVVMYAIADQVVDYYLEVTMLVGADIDALEEELFAPRGKTEIAHVYMMKRELVELRRAVSPLSVALTRILSDHQDLVSAREIRRHLRNVIDHQSMASDRIASYDDVLTSLVQAAAAQVGMQQNTDLRKISAWVAIASVPTMMAAIYGMNFEHMPELKQVWGYPAALTVMVGACSFLYLTFRRNDWM